MMAGGGASKLSSSTTSRLGRRLRTDTFKISEGRSGRTAALIKSKRFLAGRVDGEEAIYYACADLMISPEPRRPASICRFHCRSAPPSPLRNQCTVTGFSMDVCDFTEHLARS